MHKSRIKLLQRIAQAVESNTNQPSTTNTGTTTAVPPPPAFNPASGPWAWTVKYYNPTTISYLTNVLNIISTSLHYASNGQYNLVRNQNNLGSLDPSGMPSVDAKNLLLLSQLFYRTFIDNGVPFTQPPTPQQINTWCDNIINSQPLLNLSQINPTGPAAQRLQLSDSLKQIIINNLNYIKSYNPTK